MKKQICSMVLFVLPILVFSHAGSTLKQEPGWKAGVARANITPDESIWMAGFGFRNKPSEGVTTDIWASALALEDANGHRAVIIAIDNAGIRKELSDAIRAKLKTAYNLLNEQVVINSSHTHTGPATSARFLKDEKEKEKVEQYAAKLENQVVEMVGKVLNSLQPVKIYAGNGVSRFQVNRRSNIQYKLHLQEQFNGPNDYAVPVLKVEKTSGDLLAILFGYACHASMLRDYKISGDYPAFARMELEKLYPGAIPVFFQGAGGNQIGHPRNTVEATRQAGKSLAAAVERVLSEPMKELTASLATSYSEVNLESDQVSQTSGSNESVVQTYPYPVQVWKIGDLPVITLGGEPVVEYALNLKQIFGQEAFIFGYSNNVMAYISTPLGLNEGGYEGSSSPFRGAKWAQHTEAMIIQEILKLAKQAGVPMAPKKFAIPGG
jgi:hypothetical protein